ncbi:MAG: PD40 domain-containing protein [Candidatus Eisenbacteria bacterium]|nr:PD40 domain-containing protein [Candidatus Eisenbacteria bacterium]
MPVATGSARRIALEGRRVSGIAWLGPKELALSATSKLDVGLWSVHTDSGRRTLLALPGGRVQRLSYAASSHRLAFEKLSYTRAIKSVALSPSRAERSNAPRIASTQRDWNRSSLPTERGSYSSPDRAGSSDLWLADSSGGAQRRVTHQRADLMTQPRWSPDGTRVVFSFGSAGVGGVAVVDVATQIVRTLPLEGSFTVGGWSAEGDDLYASRTTEAGVELRRFRPDGSSAARFGRDGLEIVDVSPDRPGLICRDLVDRAIVFLPLDGGKEEVVVGSDRSRAWHEVAAVPGGFYLTRRSSEASTLAYFDLATGKETPLTTLEWYAASLAVSPDRTRLLYDCIQGPRDRSHADGTGGGALVGAKGGNVRSSIYGVFRLDPQTVGVLSVLPLLACCSGGCTILGTAIGESVDEVNWQRRTEPPDSLVGLQVRVAQAGSRPLVRRLVRVEVGEGGKQRLLLAPTGSESDVFERAPAGGTRSSWRRAPTWFARLRRATGESSGGRLERRSISGS